MESVEERISEEVYRRNFKTLLNESLELAVLT